tara:strand:- start:109 stop:279 length:171 start_codon:yes stop_codon:yes gene_type:complete
LTTKKGAIAQLGERYNGIVEVSGSIPLGSTKKALNFLGAFLRKPKMLIITLELCVI